MSEANVALIIFSVYAAAAIDSKLYKFAFAALWFVAYVVEKSKGA